MPSSAVRERVALRFRVEGCLLAAVGRFVSRVVLAVVQMVVRMHGRPSFLPSRESFDRQNECGRTGRPLYVASRSRERSRLLEFRECGALRNGSGRRSSERSCEHGWGSRVCDRGMVGAYNPRGWLGWARIVAPGFAGFVGLDRGSEAGCWSSVSAEHFGTEAAGVALPPASRRRPCRQVDYRAGVLDRRTY